mmetsp:Transcript_78446/g.136103  ORF Transcript_78446/g.136103 Transcript_78446/m.136103 type:complete len:92 (+) Transcript_78446:76-351(+)
MTNSSSSGTLLTRTGMAGGVIGGSVSGLRREGGGVKLTCGVAGGVERITGGTKLVVGVGTTLATGVTTGDMVQLTGGDTLTLDSFGRCGSR